MNNLPADRALHRPVDIPIQMSTIDTLTELGDTVHASDAVALFVRLTRMAVDVESAGVDELAETTGWGITRVIRALDVLIAADLVTPASTGGWDVER